jgi:hypothetical protein
MSLWKNAQNAAQPIFDKTNMYILLCEKVAQIWATYVIYLKTAQS